MTKQTSKIWYTYHKNNLQTWTIEAPTNMTLDATGLNFSSELVTKEIVTELNAAIEFGQKK